MRQVLVVDDDRDIRFTLRTLLEEEGYLVMEAAGGVEALALLHTDPPPLVVLLDYHMPRMDGWRVLLALEAEGLSPEYHRFLLLTAQHETLSLGVKKMIAHYAIPLIHKPFDIDDLLAHVRRAADDLDEPRRRRRG